MYTELLSADKCGFECFCLDVVIHARVGRILLGGGDPGTSSVSGTVCLVLL